MTEVRFTIEVIEEYTLQVLEQRYKQPPMQFDGRIFTIPVKGIVGLSEMTPELWVVLKKTAPEIVQAHIMNRLKGIY